MEDEDYSSLVFFICLVANLIFFRLVLLHVLLQLVPLVLQLLAPAVSKKVKLILMPDFCLLVSLASCDRLPI